MLVLQLLFETEAGGSQVLAQPEYLTKTLSQDKTLKKCWGDFEKVLGM